MSQEEIVSEEATGADVDTEATEQVDYKALYEQEKEAREKAERTIVESKKKSKETKVEKVATPDSVSVEKTVLLAQGMDEELIEKLEDVARFRNVSLLKAKSDPLFLAEQQEFENQKRLKQAAMGSSNGSGAGSPKLSFNSKGLTREQHKELWRQTMKR